MFYFTYHSTYGLANCQQHLEWINLIVGIIHAVVYFILCKKFKVSYLIYMLQVSLIFCACFMVDEEPTKIWLSSVAIHTYFKFFIALTIQMWLHTFSQTRTIFNAKILHRHTKLQGSIRIRSNKLDVEYVGFSRAIIQLEKPRENTLHWYIYQEKTRCFYIYICTWDPA